ncbi:MAG: HAMP domain-containing protein [Candidatus Eisenbacteria bacterium]|uniref:histidine kinase n=2 Tax=Eiseniibacteriota bacterium TaxID=2212470 RepID=A0A538SEM4_UNCEI|nr:MAG: HAMP domain-containing protein [Candidatus Eisenbacteria bacterium]
MLGTLRQRLLALFLLVSIIPSLGLTLFVTFYLSRSIAALRNPETENALSQSLEVIREGIERLGNDARQHAEVMALDPAARRLLDAGNVADLERRLRDEARSRGLDYVCLYKVGPPVQRIFGARLGPRITLPEPEQESLLAAREQGGLITGGEAPRQVSGVAPMGKGYMLLAGYQLDPEISKEILSLQKNLVMYRKLGVYTWISERSLWIFAGIWTLVLGLLSFGLAYLVSRGIARPVLELRGGMERVSGGDLSHRVTPSGTQEVRFLGKTFNEMVEELQTSRRALVRAERLAAWREVARAVAHEIRNPLTPIQFALERLREEARRPEAPRPQVVQENADLILNEVHSLQEFVNAFSAVAQLPEPRFGACDIGALAESVAKLYQGSTPVEFRVEIGAPLPLAWADEAQIQRVLVNLIKNALEASPGRGTITMRAYRENGVEPRVRVEIEDSGPGMDPATLERAVAPGFTTKSTGSGLGLTLVQRIVEQHSGRFGLESHPGIGTCAWFTLPPVPEEPS